MKKVISRQVIADWGQPGFLEDAYFRDIRERLFGPGTAYKRKKDNNIDKKKTVLDETPGLGSNDRGHNRGTGMGLGRDDRETNNRSLSSGYDDGDRADDEIGPGHKKSILPGAENPNPYYASDVYNELFLDLNLKSRNDAIQKHYKQILYGPTVNPRRFNVDQLK